MFAVTAQEATLLVVWLVGVGAAIGSVQHLRSRRHRLGLLVAAVLLPVLGSAVAVVVAVVVHTRVRRSTAPTTADGARRS